MIARERARAHFLLAGDVADLGPLRTAAARLPVDAYGQVFIEAPSSEQVRDVVVPDGLTVSWLCHETGRPRPRGELLVRAVRAWIAEWMPERRASHEIPYVLWIGCAESDRVNRLYEELAYRCHHVELESPPES